MTSKFLGTLAVCVTCATAAAQRGATHRIEPAGMTGAFDLYVDLAPGDAWTAADWRMTTFQGVTIETPLNNPLGPWQPPIGGYPGPYGGTFDTLVIGPGNQPLGISSIVFAGTSYTPIDTIVTWFTPPPSSAQGAGVFLGKVALNDLPGTVVIIPGLTPNAFAHLIVRSTTVNQPDPALNTNEFSIVPEPSTLGLLALGALSLIRRHRQLPRCQAAGPWPTSDNR